MKNSKNTSDVVPVDIPTSRGTLFSRLNSLASTKRRRLEEFLTELLAAFLSELPQDDLVELCDEFFLATATPDARRKWLTLAKSQRRLHVRVKARIEIPDVANYKFPDIVIYGESQPIAIIECKVDAKYTSSIEGEKELKEEIGQLSHYGSWLRSAGGDAAALVLVTDTTEPPSDFFDESKRFAQPRSVCRWSDLYHFFRTNDPKLAQTRNNVYGKNPWLLRELLDFLKEEELSSEDIQATDVAAATLYLPCHSRFINCLKVATKLINNPASYLPGKFSHSTGSMFVYDHDSYLVDSLYNSAGVEIGWGFWFSEADVSEWNSEYEPICTTTAGTIVYVELTTAIHRPSPDKFPSWTFPIKSTTHRDAFVLSSFDAYLGRPDASKKMAEWMQKEFSAAAELVKFFS